MDDEKEWIRVEAAPPSVRFDVPPRNAGQIVEVAYADFPKCAEPATARSASYQRVTDTSEPPGHPERVVYYRRAQATPDP